MESQVKQKGLNDDCLPFNLNPQNIISHEKSIEASWLCWADRSQQLLFICFQEYLLHEV